MSGNLTDSEYRVLVEQAPVLVWRADRSGGCDYFNSRWLEFRGRTLEQEYGNGWAEGVHADDFDRCLKIYLEAFAERRIFEMENRLQRHDGVYRWIFDRGVPFYQDGEFGGFIGSCVDVTDRIAAQEAAVRRRVEELAQLRAILPICSYCHRIRDDHGNWKPIEEYVSEHSRTEFSHGICPSCFQTTR
jgi:PAS domain S-box-containing protein